MDLQKILIGVKSLNDYIAATEKVVDKCANIKINLNMSTVLNLKKVRSLEIEYFNKCEDVGAAFVIFERMLLQPPSKTWALLGKELTATILYWLDAVRKHLISHSPRWWTFLETILQFINAMKSKDASLPGIIVTQTMERLLDLSCNDRLNELQRHDILQTINECSAESSRELRVRMKDQLSGYFIKLSKILPTCGHFPTQKSILEALLRWLVGRYDPQVRRTAALAWFPQPLYRETAIDLFLERTWGKDFYKDARDFLNIQNAGFPDRVTSTVCKQLTFGEMEIINGPLSRPTWLDVNGATRTITIALDPRVVESFAATDYKDIETLTVAEENVFSVQLYRSSSSDTQLSVHTLEPLVLAGSSASSLTAAVSSRRLATLDSALRGIFRDKYRVLLNVDDVSTSPDQTMMNPPNRLVRSADPIIRRSNIPLRRRKQSGLAAISRNPRQWNTPSSASTTSLAQLREKLAALPEIYYTKEPIKICAQPELSMVREVSEGECQTTTIIDGSDGVGAFSEQNDDPPAAQKQDKPVSSLLIATLGSADESFIKETFDKITANNPEYDLVNLILQEALQKGPEVDSGITIDKKTEDSEVIEDTPAEKQIKNKKLTRTRKAKCTIVSNSTTDESNTEPAIEVNQPCYVTDRRHKNKSKDNVNTISKESKTFDAAAVDAFFLENYTENSAGCHVISPALARKLNETSSEGSKCDHNDMDESCIRNDLILEQDIIDCLNNIVDEVCCTAEMLNKQKMQYDILETEQNVDQDQNINKLGNPKTSGIAKRNDGTKLIALKYSKAQKRVPKKKTKENTLNKDKKAENIDLYNEDKVVIEDQNTCSPLNKPNTSSIRKKRKLYSPKDDENNEDEIPLAKIKSRLSTETPIATCYKELEKERKTRSRIPRKLRTSTEASPKTKKLNDMFDKLKERVDNEETITLVKRKSNKKDLTVYNFSSDSEDEDFQKKKIVVQKRMSKTSLESTASKRGRTVNYKNYSEGNHNSSSDEIKRNTKKRKVVTQTKPRSCKVNIEKIIDLTDERMREAPPEVLETSFVIESFVEKIVPDLEPSLAHIPKVELIPEDKNDAPTAITVPENKSLSKKKAEIPQDKKGKESSNNVKKNAEIVAIKKEKGANKKGVENKTKLTDSESESSLPGLVVEREQPRKDVMSSSIEANLLQKFKKICTEGPDRDESDSTQNLLLRTGKPKNFDEGYKDVNLDMCNDNFSDVPINEDVGNTFEIVDRNQNNIHSKDVTIEPIVLLRSSSEKSISTNGTSPITGHNDLDELPPNIAFLQEKIPHRDLEIQDMDQSMADFFVQLRSAQRPPGSSTSSILKENTSELPFSRVSSKEQAGTLTYSTREWVKSPKSSSKDKVTTPKLSKKTLKVVLPVDEIEKYLSSVKSQRSIAPMSDVSAALQRMSSDKSDKYEISHLVVAELKSQKSTPSVVLERMSSDEMNKWLPMPPAKIDHSDKHIKEASRTTTPKKGPKRITKNTSERKVKGKNICTPISPVMLPLIQTDDKVSSNSSIKENANILPKTRAQTKKLNILKSKETNIEIEEDTDVLEKNNTQESSGENIRPQPMQPTGVNHVFGKARNVRTGAVAEFDESDNNEYTSENARSIIKEWFQKNQASSEYSSAKDKTNHNIKDVIEKVMETFDTTLTEMHQTTGKRVASMFLDYLMCLNNLEHWQDTQDERIERWRKELREEGLRNRERIAEFKEKLKERACKVLQEEKKEKMLLMTLLKEDLLRISKDGQNK